MTERKIKAKFASICPDCGKDIFIGNTILWRRGSKARHYDCKTSGYQNDNCRMCDGSGVLFGGRNCTACDGTGARKIQKYQEERFSDDFDGRAQFADPGGNSALRAATRGNPRNLPCPTCQEPNRLTPADVRQGYQCDYCANAEEGCF